MVSKKEPDFLAKIKDPKGDFILHIEFLEENKKADLYFCASLLLELKYPKDLIKRIIKEEIMIQSQIKRKNSNRKR
ncbi:MAG TPA: hypothetical protein EYP22_10870 [Methanosarcinales archaeon]|nr:hypothetical protein [Methanosarcinales archaeon]